MILQDTSVALEPKNLLYALSRKEFGESKSLSSENYINRDDFVAGVHVETRGGDKESAFVIHVQPDDNSKDGFIRFTTTKSGEYTRLAFSFSLTDCQLGDVIDIVWICRTPNVDTSSILASIMKCDGSKHGKAYTVPSLVPIEIGEEWRESHLLAQVQQPVMGGLFHLVFDVSEDITIDVSDVTVLKLGSQSTVSGGLGARPLKLIWPILDVPARELIHRPRKDEDGVLAPIGGQFGVSGFAWSANDPLRSVNLEIFIDGELRGVVSAEPASSLQHSSERAPGQFVYSLPHTVFDGAEHVFEVRCSEDGHTLRGGVAKAKFENPHEGLVEIGSNGRLVGWAVDKVAAPEPVMVEILVDGKMVAEILADRPHQVLTGPRYNNGRCAFELPLPVEFRDGAFHELAARVKGGSTTLAGSERFRLGDGRFLIHVDEAMVGRLIGWIIDLNGSEQSLALSVAVNGRLFGTVRADRPVPSLNGRRCGFSSTVPSGARTIELSVENYGIVAVYDVSRSADLIEVRAPLAAEVTTATSPLLEEFFDPEWYLAFYPQVAAELGSGAANTALAHWIAIGAAREMNPTPWFDEAWYKAEYVDAAAAIAGGQASSAFQQWLSVVAIGDWRRVSPALDILPLLQWPQEAPLAAVRRWLLALNTPSHAVRAAEGSPVSTLRELLACRRKATIFDAHTKRLIKEVGLVNSGDSAALRDGLEKSETEALQRVLERPVTSEPLVSIIMPTFNRGYLIAEAIQSVIDQSWSNFELIICDDGSTDKTSLVVKEFADPRIRYLQMEKANGAVARNFGLKFANGKYIAFLDSDNIWHPFFLHIAISEIASNLNPIIYTGYIDTNVQGAFYSSAELRTTTFDYQSLLSRNYIDLNTVVLDRAVYDSLGGFDETLERVQDWDLMLRYCRLVTPVGIPVYGVFYRRNIAWGQVTRLISHTNFKQVVGDRALNRLQSCTMSITSNEIYPLVSLIGGDNRDDARDLVLLAGLLGEFSRVRLILKDDDAIRRFVSSRRTDPATPVVWVTTPSDALQAIAGEVLVLASDAADPLAGGSLDLPVLRLERVGDQCRLTRAGAHGSGVFPIGALRLGDADVPLTLACANKASARSTMVVALQGETLNWRRELWKRSSGDPSYLVGLCPDDTFSVRLFDGDEQEKDLDANGLVELVGKTSAVALLAPSEQNRPLLMSLGVAALAQQTVLVTTYDPSYLAWLLSKIAHRAKDPSPIAVLKQIDAIRSDEKFVELTTRRGRRSYEHLHQRNAMVDRLKLIMKATSGYWDEVGD